MTRFKIVIFALLTLSTIPGTSLAALAVTGAAYLNAQPGSWVGGALEAPEVTWIHGNQGIFSIGTNFDQGVAVGFDDGHGWLFEFAAPTYDPVTNTNNGNRLVVKFYNHATRFPFNSPTRPGLSFSGNGRGNNTLGGWFDILAISYLPGGEVTSLAVDFRQFDESENMTGPSTYGSIRINSSIPINFTDLHPVPLPGTAGLLLSSVLLVACAMRRRAL